ncbi:MAG: [FeFe] hydrogenase H-cluster maturation GTPase HydF [Archaeoglobus sp.]|nr:MAG: [FeFe] hydrogenase H-cluster maturation GTPase HydF [Archaeoglobus sp.]
MQTPRALRLHIGIFGRRNAGKSTLINALAGKEIAIVSEVAGTTTDPVFFDAEIGNIPVTFIDTAGIDDIGELGKLRTDRTLDTLNKVDVALLIVDATKGFENYERNLIKLFKESRIKFIVVINKIDIADYNNEEIKKYRHVKISAKEGINIDKLIDMILRISPDIDDSQFLDDLIKPKDLAILNIPIDLGAPKGRLIYPQVQAIRNILDRGASCIVVKERELKWVFDGLKKKPEMVITDSHTFTRAAADTPEDVPLTSFSILEARFKTGNLPELIRGLSQIKKLKPGDRVLVAEACTHHPSPDDIGRVKIPRWIRNIAGDVKFDHVMGGSFPSGLSKYKLIIHCGACTLTRRHMRYRLNKALNNGVPITNYGLVIAFVHGILPRAIEMFPDAMKIWKEFFEDYEGNP